jgi:hypothetical protein
MKLTHTQKEVFPADVQIMIEAGFLTPEGKITEDLTYYIRHLNFVALKSKILARAKEIVAEDEEE